MPLWSEECPPDCFNIVHQKRLHLYPWPLITTWTQTSKTLSHSRPWGASTKAGICHQGCKPAPMSLAIAWLDLANVYGSVSHQLIQFALSHYYTPAEFLALVSNLYEKQQAVITWTQWETKPVNLLVSVFQGDPLSVSIFNTDINLLLDHIHISYALCWLLLLFQCKRASHLVVCWWHLSDSQECQEMPADAPSHGGVAGLGWHAVQGFKV